MDKGVTLVTGASKGIGLAIARHLLAQGQAVVGMARTLPAGAEFPFVTADLADAAATAAALAQVVADHRVLRLVNNAGFFLPASLDDATPQELDAMMALNLRAPLQAMQAVVPGMRAAGFGRIVNIGSRAALGKPGRMLYGASKAALVGLTRTAALELAGDGITVNCIAPGPVETEFFAANNPPGTEQRRRFTAAIPTGRMGQPEEIAHAVAGLLDARAGYTTGQVLNICGGLTIGTAAF